MIIEVLIVVGKPAAAANWTRVWNPSKKSTLAPVAENRNIATKPSADVLNRIDPTWIVNDKLAAEDPITGHFVSRHGALTRAELILPSMGLKLLYYREYWVYEV